MIFYSFDISGNKNPRLFLFLFLKEDIHRVISSTELFLSDIRGLRYTGFKKVNFFLGHPVGYQYQYGSLAGYWYLYLYRYQGVGGTQV